MFKFIFSLAHSLVSLCSNDKNLCSKALLSGVKALSKADLEKEVEGTRSTILNYCHTRPTVPPLAGPVEKGLLLTLALSLSLFLLIIYKVLTEVILLPPPYVNDTEKEGLQKHGQSDVVEQQQLSECVSLLESCLQRALSEVLEEEMKAAYGDLWTEVPPMIVHSCINVI